MKKIEHLTNEIIHEYVIPYTRKPSTKEIVNKINGIIDRFNEIDDIQLRQGKIKYLITKLNDRKEYND